MESIITILGVVDYRIIARTYCCVGIEMPTRYDALISAEGILARKSGYLFIVRGEKCTVWAENKV